MVVGARYTQSIGGSGSLLQAYRQRLYQPPAGSSTTWSAVQPAVLSAKTDRDLAQQSLGLPMSAVIGTGRVNGAYFIGGQQTINTITTTVDVTFTTQEIDLGRTYTTYGGGLSNTNPNGPTENSYGSGNPVRYIRNEATTSSVSSETQTFAGYLLAYDYFGRGYDLIRLEVNGEVVFDTEEGIGQTTSFRFYGGKHSSRDPIVKQIVGEDNAGAYKRMVMVFLAGYPADAPPSIQAVISNAATDRKESRVIQWTGTPPVADMSHQTAGDKMVYDPGKGQMYQIFSSEENPGATLLYLVVLDIDTARELYRVPLQDSEDYAGEDGLPLGSTQWAYVMRGTDFIFVKFKSALVGVPNVHRVYNVVTGELVASRIENSAIEEVFDFLVGGQFRADTYVFVGYNHGDGFSNDEQTVYAIVDTARGTIDVGYLDEEGEGVGNLVRGRSVNGGISFFGVKYISVGLLGLYEITYDGQIASKSLIGTTAIESFTGLHYDNLTGQLIISGAAETSTPVKYEIRHINPDTGALISVLDTTPILYWTPHNAVGSLGVERLWPKPGYAIFSELKVAATLYHVVLYNIEEQTFSDFTVPADLDGTVADAAVFDQTHGLYITGYDERNYTVHYLPNGIPGQIDLDDAVRDVMSLAGYTSGELTFEGFGGKSTYGFVIAANTTTQVAADTLASIYDFTWCDTGNGYFFKFPGEDEAFSVDIALTRDDLVFGEPAVPSEDGSDLGTPSAVEMNYISKEGHYRSRPASFSMPAGVTISRATPRYDTPIVLTDEEAQSIVTRKFLQAQEKRRTHTIIVPPEHMVGLPGDTVSFPSGDITFVTRIMQVDVDFRDMSVKFAVQDFKTEMEIEITAVTNTGMELVRYSFYSQYIHMDIPLYLYSDDTDGASLVQYGILAPRGQGNWTGGLLYRGAADVDMPLIFDQAPHFGLMGICTTVLPAPDFPHAADFVNSVTVNVITGMTPSDASEAAVAAGTNLAFIGKPGRWEGLGFTTVTDNDDGSLTFSGFVFRGYRGTEVYQGTHEIGDIFVTVNPSWLRKMQHPVSDHLDTLYYRAVGFDQSPTLVASVQRTISGAAEMPYAPVNLEAVLDSDIMFSWDYRSRVEAWAIFDSTPDSGEAMLEFEIDIVVGGSVVHTIDGITTNSYSWALTDAITALGSVPPTLTWRVYMISATVGRGHRAEATSTL